MALCAWREADKCLAWFLTADGYEFSQGGLKQDVGQWNPDLPDSETASTENPHFTWTEVTSSN